AAVPPAAGTGAITVTNTAPPIGTVASAGSFVGERGGANRAPKDHSRQRRPAAAPRSVSPGARLGSVLGRRPGRSNLRPGVAPARAPSLGTPQAIGRVREDLPIRSQAWVLSQAPGRRRQGDLVGRGSQSPWRVSAC